MGLTSLSSKPLQGFGDTQNPGFSHMVVAVCHQKCFSSDVAQLVERRTHNAEVFAGSIPAIRTITGGLSEWSKVAVLNSARF